MATSTVSDLLGQLDRTAPDALPRVEDAVVAQGEAAIDSLLMEIDTINQRQKTSVDSLTDIPALERRVRVLGRIRSPRAIRAVLNALADTAIAVQSYRQQRGSALSPFNPRAPADPMLLMTVHDQHIWAAESLNAAAIEALANYGNDALPYIQRYIDQVPPPVRKSLLAARRKIQPPWWRLW